MSGRYPLSPKAKRLLGALLLAAFLVMIALIGWAYSIAEHRIP